MGPPASVAVRAVGDTKGHSAIPAACVVRRPCDLSLQCRSCSAELQPAVQLLPAAPKLLSAGLGRTTPAGAMR